MIARVVCLLLVLLYAASGSVRGAEAESASAEAAHADSASADSASTGHADDHPDYNQPPLTPNVPLLLFTLVTYGLFVLVMRPLVWQPLIRGLNDREQRIAHAASEAHQARVEIEKLSAQAEKRLAETQEQVAAILAEARKEAEARKAEIIAQGERDALRIKEETLAEIRQAHADALGELEQMIESQVSLATEHVSGRRF